MPWQAQIAPGPSTRARNNYAKGKCFLRTIYASVITPPDILRAVTFTLGQRRRLGHVMARVGGVG